MSLNDIVELTQSPWVVCLIALFSLIGVPITIFLAIKGEKRIEVSYCYDVKKIIDKAATSFDGVSAFYKDMRVDELFEFTAYIWNSGTEAITSKELDYVDFILNGPSCVLYTEVDRITTPENMFLCFVKEDGNVRITFNYMNVNDGIRIKAICSGESGFVPVSAPLINGKVNKEKKTRTTGELVKVMTHRILITLVPLFFVMLMFYISSRTFQIEYVLTFLAVWVIPDLAINTVIFIHKICKHRVVPLNLEKSKIVVHNI